MVKFRKKIGRGSIQLSPFMDILRKKHLTITLRVLSYFIKDKTAKQKDLIEEIFGKVATDKYERFVQRFGLTIVFLQLRKNYGVYIKTISGDTPYCKILTTNKEFEELLQKIEGRIESLEIERDKVKGIINDMDGYHKKIDKLLDTMREYERKNY